METLKAALVAYGVTIIFAMLIACLIPLLGWAVKKLNLDRSEEIDIGVPTSNTLKENEEIAVAIAVAYARQK